MDIIRWFKIKLHIRIAPVDAPFAADYMDENSFDEPIRTAKEVGRGGDND